MVAASKMRRDQERMRAGRPYATKVREIASHLMQAHPEYHHPYMLERASAKAVGIILITTDKGLCGGLNSNITRLVLSRIREFDEKGLAVQTTGLGKNGVSFLTRVGANLVSSEVQLGAAPNVELLM